MGIKLKHKNKIKWLYNELPSLIDKNIVSPEAAEKIREYYGPVQGLNPTKLAMIILGIIGAFFVGSGVILIIGHNWDMLSRPGQAVICFIPLLISQSLVLYTVLKKYNSTSWREGNAIFLSLTIPSCIAGISQIYQTGGHLETFLLTWMLLMVPIIYLLKSSTPCIIYLACLIGWLGQCFDIEANTYQLLLWPLLALVIPHLWISLKENLYSLRSAVLNWFFAIFSIIILALFSDQSSSGLWIISFAALFGVCYLIDKFFFQNASSIWQRPLAFLGFIGTVVFSFMLTYESVCKTLNWNYNYSYYHYRILNANNILTIRIITVILFLILISLITYAIIKRKFLFLAFAALPMLTVLAYFLMGFFNFLSAFVIIFNLYYLFLGINTLYTGVKEQKISLLNYGMGMLMLIIIFRFFSYDIDMIIRGVAFIFLGTIILSVNYIFLKKSKNKITRAEV